MRASEQARAEDARLLGLAQNGMTTAVHQIEAALATVRMAQEQKSAQERRPCHRAKCPSRFHPFTAVFAFLSRSTKSPHL
jgi:hypothetical protein